MPGDALPEPQLRCSVERAGSFALAVLMAAMFAVLSGASYALVRADACAPVGEPGDARSAARRRRRMTGKPSMPPKLATIGQIGVRVATSSAAARG